MRRGDEASFELRRRKVDAFIEHAVKIFFEAFAIAFHGVGEVVNRFAREVAAEHGAAGNELHGDAGGFGGVAHAGFELPTEFFKLAVGAARFQFLQRSNACGHGDGISAERAGLVDRAEWREAIHDVRAATECADGQSAADDFAEASQIGRDFKAVLRAAPGEAEAGHDFVEDQQCAIGFRDLTEKFQVARFRQIQAGIAGHGFDDDASDLILVRGECGFDGVDVIERQNDGVLREGGGNARAVGIAERERAGTGFDQKRIGVTVVAAVELDDFVALGEAPREADGGHAGFGAGIGHAHFFDARHKLADQFRHGDFRGVGNAKARAVLGSGFYGGIIFGCAWPRIAGPQVQT